MTQERPVIYQVGLQLKTDIQDKIIPWLLEHIAEMEKLPGFLPETQLLQDCDDPLKITALYKLENYQAFQEYLENHAPKMRGELSEELKSQIEFSRSLSYCLAR